MTSAETKQTLRELVDILAEAEAIARDAFDRSVALTERAELLNRQTAGARLELEQFLELFALESSAASGAAENPTFLGGAVDMDAMRFDVVNVALNASKAAILASSMRSFRNSLDQAARYFADDSALTVSLDATAEQFQTAVNEAREDERRRLAREIHDGPAQVLANAIYAVQILEELVKRNPDAVLEELATVRELLKEGVTEVRRFMFDLRPATLHDYGLATTVQRYVEDYGRFFGRRATFTLSGVLPPLAPEQDLTIFRIIQEALQNAHKHAGSDASLEVEISADNESITVRVADDGIGFDPALVAPKLTSGAGILGMRERASIARARLTIESDPGEGSTVTLILPIDPQTELGAARTP